jgi:hypothetical protein
MARIAPMTGGAIWLRCRDGAAHDRVFTIIQIETSGL